MIGLHDLQLIRPSDVRGVKSLFPAFSLQHLFPQLGILPLRIATARKKRAHHNLTFSVFSYPLTPHPGP